jgi:hypothetical protein
VTSFVESTAQRDPASLAPPGAPEPGATAPWLRAWDPLGYANDAAVGARGAFEAEKSADVADANAAVAIVAQAGQTFAAGEHGDLATSVQLLLDGDAETSGVNDVIAAQLPGMRAPTDAVPAFGAPAASAPSVPDVSPARPTGALAAFRPPAVRVGDWHPESGLADSRDALLGWAEGTSAWSFVRAGEAQSDVQSFVGTAGAFAGATAATAADVATSTAGAVPASLPGAPDAPQPPSVPN